MGLNELIRELRVKNNIAQAALAEAINCTHQAYSLKELGKRQFKFNEVEAIARELNVDPSYFFGEKINVKLNKDSRSRGYGKKPS